jgi:hypothetical protein
MATYGAAPEDGGLQELFEASPDQEVHTSAAAETAFVLGLVALVSAPFSMMHGISFAAGAAGALCGLVGVATTSRPNVAGRMLVPAGLFFSVTALVLIGLRYLNVDTAFGDGLVPTLSDWLDSLNSRLPAP